MFEEAGLVCLQGSPSRLLCWETRRSRSFAVRRSNLRLKSALYGSATTGRRAGVPKSGKLWQVKKTAAVEVRRERLLRLEHWRAQHALHVV